MEEIEVKEVEPLTVMSQPFTGSYDQAQDKLEHLMSWLLRVGHPYSEPPRAIFYDDPEVTPADELRAEVCLPIEEACEGEGDIVRKTLPAQTVATMTHQGPREDQPEVYHAIFDWIEQSDYRYIEGEPTREVYHRMYGQAEDPEEFVTEYQVPVEN
jgi:AraC family transcriptional regulator